MFHTPAHKQADPAKQGAQIVNPLPAALIARRAAVSWPDVADVIAYENGEMDFDEVVTFFQAGIDSGRVWQLQGSYGRMAAWLIETGRCTLAIR